MNIENHMVIGSPEPEPETCPHCDGNGWEWDHDEDGAFKARCGACDGTGEYIEEDLLDEDQLGDE